MPDGRLAQSKGDNLPFKYSRMLPFSDLVKELLSPVSIKSRRRASLDGALLPFKGEGFQLIISSSHRDAQLGFLRCRVRTPQPVPDISVHPYRITSRKRAGRCFGIGLMENSGLSIQCRTWRHFMRT